MATAKAGFIVVHSAETGMSHPILSCDSVRSLQTKLEDVSGIARKDQILLVGGPPYVRLDSHRNIQDISSQKVFLFDRKAIVDSAPSEEAVAKPSIPLKLKDIPQQPQRNLEREEVSSISSNPFFKAVLEYELNLALHYEIAEANGHNAEERIKACKMCLSEQNTQVSAIDAAIDNLSTHWQTTFSSFNQLASRLQRIQTLNKETVSKFDVHLAELKSIQIHPAFGGETQMTLLDLLPVERLRSWITDSETTIFGLVERSIRLSEDVDSLNVDVEELASNARSADCHSDLRSFAVKVERLLEGKNDFSVSLSTLSANHADAWRRVKEISEAMRNSLSTSSLTAEGGTALMDAARVLEQYYSSDLVEILPSVEEFDQETARVLEELLANKQLVLKELHGRLLGISSLQGRIKVLSHKMKSLKTASDSQSTSLSELEHLSALPMAYRATLGEVARRRHFGKLFASRLEAMAEALSSLRTEEVVAREIFSRTHGCHLPRSFCPVLNDMPTHCEITALPFDVGLPVISVEDVPVSPIPVTVPLPAEEERVGGSIVLPAMDTTAERQLPELQYEHAKLKARVAELEATSDATSELQVLLQLLLPLFPPTVAAEGGLPALQTWGTHNDSISNEASSTSDDVPPNDKGLVSSAHSLPRDRHDSNPMTQSAKSPPLSRRPIIVRDALTWTPEEAVSLAKAASPWLKDFVTALCACKTRPEEYSSVARLLGYRNPRTPSKATVEPPSPVSSALGASGTSEEMFFPGT